MLILVIYHNFPLQSSGIYVDSVIFTEKYTVRHRCGIPDSGKVKEGWKEQWVLNSIFLCSGSGFFILLGVNALTRESALRRKNARTFFLESSSALVMIR